MIKVYALKDVKSGFMSLLCLKNDDLAIRSYRSVLNSGDTMVSQNPEDFELWCLGDYDQDTGIIKSDVRFVSSAATLNG